MHISNRSDCRRLLHNLRQWYAQLHCRSDRSLQIGAKCERVARSGNRQCVFLKLYFCYFHLKPHVKTAHLELVINFFLFRVLHSVRHESRERVAQCATTAFRSILLASKRKHLVAHTSLCFLFACGSNIRIHLFVEWTVASRQLLYTRRVVVTKLDVNN